MTDSNETIVMTGATGFLGSHLMAALVQRGDRLIILGRPQGTRPLRERVDALLASLGATPKKHQVDVLEADFSDPSCGLNWHQYAGVCLKATHFLHCASDTRFSETNRLASIQTNVRSLASIIELARRSRAAYFHYVSTAYVFGAETSSCPEAPVIAARHANVYEETKAWAERDVAEECSRLGIPYTILRPSIVYGDSRTGQATRFTALYHHVRSLSAIRDIYLKEIRELGGEKARRHGIYLDADGTLHLPLRIHLPRRGSVNLIPIDYFVAAVLAVLDRPDSDTIYHLTSNRPVSMEELACYCERFLNIRGIKVHYGPAPEGFAPNPAEALFDKFVEPYRPYLSDIRNFERRHTDVATEGIDPPELTYDVFERCMAFAAGANWGR
ncbi:SDR family oxidoreductase [Geomesophilobacter sediminis]|uniref:SDR family oxidoreductase n=1 Tax=Geomesophilobacter sediminis TaxID=2798584 RepID=A0A8J7LZE6_9BACT|nr:SDR family oxidoreductase [Geomesophilobacter sediminis]MBJ6726286.1 SDR family oxidoreductase [Geomesophilobacter sediminis]